MKLLYKWLLNMSNVKNETFTLLSLFHARIPCIYQWKIEIIFDRIISLLLSILFTLYVWDCWVQSNKKILMNYNLIILKHFRITDMIISKIYLDLH